MIKDIIAKKGISVYRLAKDSGLAYSTLNELVLGKKDAKDCSIKTIAAIARALGISIDKLYIELTENQDYSTTQTAGNWEAARHKKYKFPDLVKSNNYNSWRVHPLKQRVVDDIYNVLKDHPAILSMQLFGGSTTIRCTKDSDIDLAVELFPSANSDAVKAEISELIQDACGYNADIIWMDKVVKGSQLDENIKRGVKIL